MSHCTECGAERPPGTRFCIRCGARLWNDEDGRTEATHDDVAAEPPEHRSSEYRHSAPPTSMGHRPGWYAGLAGGVALLVVGVVLGAMAVTRTGPWAETASVSTGDPGTTTFAPPPSTTPTTQTPVPQETAIQTPAEPTVGNDVVAVAAPVAADPRAPGVVELLTTYFQSINARDFVTYRSLYTPDLQSSMNLDDLAVGYRSTQDSGVELVSLEDQPDGRLAARVDFVSTQDAADGPEGLTCTHWNIALFLQADATGRWWTGRVPPGYHAAFQGC